MAANSCVMNAATVGLGFAGFYALREYMRGGQCTSDVRMDGKGGGNSTLTYSSRIKRSGKETTNTKYVGPTLNYF